MNTINRDISIIIIGKRYIKDKRGYENDGEIAKIYVAGHKGMVGSAIVRE